ncbi:hypothetical protein ACTA71_005333 [Dictyostelium dimigraforme]
MNTTATNGLDKLYNCHYQITQHEIISRDQLDSLNNLSKKKTTRGTTGETARKPKRKNGNKDKDKDKDNKDEKLKQNNTTIAKHQQSTFQPKVITGITTKQQLLVSQQNQQCQSLQRSNKKVYWINDDWLFI